MRKIKVLEMIDQPFLGGGQKNLLSLARSLDKDRFEVSVCSKGDGPLVHELQKEGIEHFPILFSKRISVKIIREIVSLQKCNCFDILHTHGGVAGLYGRLAVHKCHFPVVVHTLHGIHYLHHRNFLLRYIFVFIERYLSKVTDALICVSHADRGKAQRLKLAPEEKIFMIENGIDFFDYLSDEKQAEIGHEFGVTSPQPTVGTVARLHRQKGLPYLIEAAKKISRIYPKVKVFIVGEGPQRQKLERLIKKMGLINTVQLLGERKDIMRIFSLFDVFVLPSLWEGLPYVLIEAGACGLAVVASDIDGIKEIIKDGETGVLVSPKDSDALARSIVKILPDEDMRDRLGRNLKNAVFPRYTLSRMVQQTQELYRRIYEESKTTK